VGVYLESDDENYWDRMEFVDPDDDKWKDYDSEIDLKYCPKIQFFTLDHSRNITAVLKTSCDKDFEDLPAVGDSVDIQYDPSDLSDVVDADIPSNIGIAMVATIVISTLCSCGYVMFGIMLYKAEKAKNNTNSMQNNHSVPYDNNHTGPSSIPMSNIGGDSNRYAETSAYNHHNYTSNGPVETTASAVPIAQHEVQAQGSAPMVSIFPEGTPTTTAITSGETAPPMVGATLIPSTAERNSQTYVSPASLPTIPQSTYVSPLEVNQARATANGPL